MKKTIRIIKQSIISIVGLIILLSVTGGMANILDEINNKDNIVKEKVIPRKKITTNTISNKKININKYINLSLRKHELEKHVAWSIKKDYIKMNIVINNSFFEQNTQLGLDIANMIQYGYSNEKILDYIIHTISSGTYSLPLKVVMLEQNINILSAKLTIDLTHIKKGWYRSTVDYIKYELK